MLRMMTSLFYSSLKLCRSLNQLKYQSQTSSGNGTNPQFSPHDFDVFLKPSHTQPVATPPPPQSSFDPFWSPAAPSFAGAQGNGRGAVTVAPSTLSFDPFGTPSHTRPSSSFHDPFAPSFTTPSSTAPPSASISFDPFAPSQPVAAVTPSSSATSQFDLDFNILSQSHPTVVQKHYSLGALLLAFPLTLSLCFSLLSLSLSLSLWVSDEPIELVRCSLSVSLHH
jgi:hypothetical protein